MATQENMALVQKLYLAYYGRPADPGGQAFWAERLEENNGNLDAIIDAFGNSAEFDSRFGDFSNDELIDNLYQQIFGRPADEEGRAFYVQSLNEGSRSLANIATSIVDGAQNEDVTVIDNRVAVANGITRGVQERDLEYGPAQIEAAGQLVANVAANTNVNEYIQSAVNQFLEWPADQLVDDYSPDRVFTNGVIATGQSLTGSLEVTGDEDWFAIGLNADTEVTIDLTGNFDTVLEVRDSQGNLVTSNDDGGEGFNSRLTLEVSETDTYYLVAGAYSDAFTGDYTLNVSPAIEMVTEPEPEPESERLILERFDDDFFSFEPADFEQIASDELAYNSTSSQSLNQIPSPDFYVFDEYRLTANEGDWEIETLTFDFLNVVQENGKTAWGGFQGLSEGDIIEEGESIYFDLIFSPTNNRSVGAYVELSVNSPEGEEIQILGLNLNYQASGNISDAII